MISLLANFFRQINSRLLLTDNPFLHRILKLFYGLSALFFRLGIGRKPGLITIENFDGELNLQIDSSKNLGATLFWTGFHELHELLFLNKFLKPEMVVADVGANIGVFTTFIAKRVKNGKVIAFEPVPVIYEQLKENIKLNNFTNVILRKEGLANQKGISFIHEIESSNEGLSTLFPGDLKTARKTEINLFPLDELFPEFSLNRLDLIKIDIEGGELPALKGMEKLISTFKPSILVEINQRSYSSAGYTPEEVFEFFHKLGYKAFEITRKGELTQSKQIKSFVNIVFTCQ